MRGTSRIVPEPQIVVIYDRQPSPPASAATLGSNGANRIMAARPVVSRAVGWHVTGVDLLLYKAGGGSPTFDTQLYIWASNGSTPTGAPLAQSPLVNAATFSASPAWQHFDLTAPLDLPGAGDIWIGVGASASGGNWVNWQTGGSLGGGRVFNTLPAPPVNAVNGTDQPWLRVYGWLL